MIKARSRPINAVTVIRPYTMKKKKEEKEKEKDGDYEYVMFRFSCKHVEAPLRCIRSEVMRYYNQVEFEEDKDSNFLSTKEAISKQYNNEGLWEPSLNSLSLVRNNIFVKEEKDNDVDDYDDAFVIVYK